MLVATSVAALGAFAVKLDIQHWTWVDCRGSLDRNHSGDERSFDGSAVSEIPDEDKQNLSPQDASSRPVMRYEYRCVDSWVVKWRRSKMKVEERHSWLGD